MDFFSTLLQDDGVSFQHPSEVDDFVGYIPSILTDSDNSSLLWPISMDEVQQAVFKMDPASSPGPDGFPGKFYQFFWDVIGSDLTHAVQEFFVGVPVPGVLAVHQLCYFLRNPALLFLEISGQFVFVILLISCLHGSPVISCKSSFQD